VLLVLFGATAGQAVVWYAGQFYSLFFLTQTLRVDATTANLLIAGSLIIGTPFFIVFGWLSDRIGRKPIVLAGCLIAALTYFPIFRALTHAANPALEAAASHSPVTVAADPSTCSFQFNPVGTRAYTSSCDLAKSALARGGTPYANRSAAAGSIATIHIGDRTVRAFEGNRADDAEAARFTAELQAALGAAGYPTKADPARIDHATVLALLTLLVIYVTMVYGPIAAWLVELFPTRIRYTSMSLPYHIGNGWFGGFLPTTAFAMVAATGDIYSGLWYPIAVALMSFVIGSLFLRETRDVDIAR
jgi:MFS family permease